MRRLGFEDVAAVNAIGFSIQFDNGLTAPIGMVLGVMRTIMKISRIYKQSILAFWCVLSVFSRADARLSSTGAQESRMIKIAVQVGERWQSSLNDFFRKNESILSEVAQQRKEIGSYETGILEDMSIASEIASMVVYAQHVNPVEIRAIDGFDSAAEKLSNIDQVRYYCAKARIHGGFVKTGLNPDTFAIIMEKQVNDYCRAAENGFEPKKAVAAVSRQIGDAGFDKSYLDQYMCRIYQAYLPFAITKIKELHGARKYRDGFELAARTMREIPPTMNLKTSDCAAGGGPESIQTYDSRLIAAACRYLATYADQLLVETCREYWENKPLVSLLLPRIKSPSRDAFDLFKKAGEDESLKHSGAIAWAELSIWKKAAKLKEFKKLYPDRYRLALPARTKSKT
jgi:hypothetical protein